MSCGENIAPVAAGCGGFFTSTGTILVLFILLVIVSRAILY
ncbi:sporulation protein YjcZ [Paenibacillus sp. y28]